MKPPYAIGSVPSFGVTQLRTDGVHCRESAGTGPVNLKGSSKRVLPWQVTMDQLIFASLSHTHYWYEVGSLKVPAVMSGQHFQQSINQPGMVANLAY